MWEQDAGAATHCETRLKQAVPAFNPDKFALPLLSKVILEALYTTSCYLGVGDQTGPYKTLRLASAMRPDNEPTAVARDLSGLQVAT